MARPKAQPKTCSRCRDNKYVYSAHEGKLRAEFCECFHCEECAGEGRIFRQNDQGIAFLSDCSSCANLGKRLHLLNDAGIPGKFSPSSFENYNPIGSQNKIALSRALDFVKDVKEAPKEPHRGLLFMGGPGQGKTHLVVSILNNSSWKKGSTASLWTFFIYCLRSGTVTPRINQKDR